jgi:hypothetical protein
VILTTFYIQICTSVQEQNVSANEITIYPNPATNTFTIYDVRFTIEKIAVYNPLGKIILNQQQTANSQSKLH